MGSVWRFLFGALLLAAGAAVAETIRLTAFVRASPEVLQAKLVFSPDGRCVALQRCLVQAGRIRALPEVIPEKVILHPNRRLILVCPSEVPIGAMQVDFGKEGLVPIACMCHGSGGLRELILQPTDTKGRVVKTACFRVNAAGLGGCAMPDAVGVTVLEGGCLELNGEPGNPASIGAALNRISSAARHAKSALIFMGTLDESARFVDWANLAESVPEGELAAFQWAVLREADNPPVSRRVHVGASPVIPLTPLSARERIR